MGPGFRRDDVLGVIPALAGMTDESSDHLRDTRRTGATHHLVFPAKAGIQRSVAWIPAYAGMTDWV